MRMTINTIPVPFCLILTTFLYLAVILYSSSGLAAPPTEWTNVKTVGGSIGECSAASLNSPGSSLPMDLKVVKEQKTGSVLVSDFEAQFVECKKTVWSSTNQIQNDFTKNFKDDIGQVQSEKISYNNFRVQVKDQDGKQIQLISVSANEGSSKIRFKVKVNSLDLSKAASTHTKFVDVSLVADRIRQTSSDRFFEEVNWGTYRIQLTSE